MYRRIHLHEAIKSASSVLLCHQCVQSVTNSHCVSHDLFIYYLNWMGVTSEMAVGKVDKSYIVSELEVTI